MTNIEYILKKISTPHLRELLAFTNKIIHSNNKEEDFEVARIYITDARVSNLIECMVKNSQPFDELIKKLMDLNLEVECELFRRFLVERDSSRRFLND